MNEISLIENQICAGKGNKSRSIDWTMRNVVWPLRNAQSLYLYCLAMLMERCAMLARARLDLQCCAMLHHRCATLKLLQHYAIVMLLHRRTTPMLALHDAHFDPPLRNTRA